jgi:hypothetical protein
VCPHMVGVYNFDHVVRLVAKVVLCSCAYNCTIFSTVM